MQLKNIPFGTQIPTVYKTSDDCILTLGDNVDIKINLTTNEARDVDNTVNLPNTNAIGVTTASVASSISFVSKAVCAKEASFATILATCAEWAPSAVCAASASEATCATCAVSAVIITKKCISAIYGSSATCVSVARTLCSNPDDLEPRILTYISSLQYEQGAKKFKKQITTILENGMTSEKWEDVSGGEAILHS